MSEPRNVADRPGGLFEVACGALLVVLLVLVVTRHDVAELRDELRIERARRLDAQRIARERSQQMDGALEKIHQLQADPEPDPEPDDALG